jgi:mRNA-degrading endonuclease toxin of MazEF toxin-antitoxin module
MPISGDIVDLDLGMPEGREAGFHHPAVVVTAQRILNTSPSVIHVVPLTSTIRGFDSEITIESDAIPPPQPGPQPPPPQPHPNRPTKAPIRHAR